MAPRPLLRWNKRLGTLLATLLASGTLLSGSCMGSDIAKRFRETYAPGFASGVSTALSGPDQLDAGLQEMAAALSDALAAVIDTRTPSSLGSSSSSTGSSSDGGG